MEILYTLNLLWGDFMIFKFEDLGTANLIQQAVYKGGSNKNPMKDDPLSKIFIIEGCEKGIGNQGGFRKTSKEKDGRKINGTIAFVVIVDSGKQVEWPNEMDEDTGIFTYYGDNRTVGNNIFRTKNLGNKFLYEIFSKSYLGPDERATIPPIFIFKSTGSGSDKKFIGLAVPGVRGKSMEESLERRVFKVDEGEFENYVANFTVLDVEGGVIDRDWLKDLKNMNSKFSYEAPKEWNEFVLNGLNNISINKSYEEIEIREEVYGSYNNEVERKIKVRVTQGKFRDNLLKRDRKCVICGLNIEALLVASHIKPWSKSNDYEKQDENNGLLLCANHDALFDKGYISFDDNGSIIISSKIDKENYGKLNIGTNSNVLFKNEEQRQYIKYHVDNIFMK